MAMSYTDALLWTIPTTIAIIIFPCLAICSRTVQRHALYANKLTLAPFYSLTEPEKYGFLPNQAISFFISSTNNVRLHAWLITPMDVYTGREKEFFSEKDGTYAIDNSLAFKSLRESNTAKLIVYFHGNADCLAQYRRLDVCRLFSSGFRPETYVLIFDYRGFGLSGNAASPTESGLVDDGLAVVDWAMHAARLTPERIFLAGESLGTAVASGVTARCIKQDPIIRFGGVALFAPFGDATRAMRGYNVGGVVPLLWPLRFGDWGRKWMDRWIVDRWDTYSRVREIVEGSRGDRLRLLFVHAKDDGMISWEESERLFACAVGESAVREITSVGDGSYVRVKSNDIEVSKFILPYGDHNGITKWSAGTWAMLKIMSN